MAATKSIQELISKISPYYAKKGEPESEHTLVYESYSDTLEPIYYFLLDLMDDFGLNPEKLIDNFSPSPGSSQFGEMGTKATAMQQQASKMMGDINTVLRSVLNLVYDLKEFKTRLRHYDDLNSSDKESKGAAKLALKQIWMDKVDMEKGNSAIKAMAAKGGFVTLIDAFLASDSIKDVENLDLNDRVKRVIIPRIQEFHTWLENSEQELRKRYQIERSYLKSQVNSLKLYARWAKPYLTATRDLERGGSKNPGLVKAFNRTILELTLLGKHSLNVKKEAIEGDFPNKFANRKFLRKIKRGYNSCILIDFVFRAVPKQGTYIGKADVTFSSYALNDEELDKLKKELDKSDFNNALNLIEGATTESINQLREDVNAFLEEEAIEPDKPKKESKKNDSSNPFLALIGHYNKDSKNKNSSKKNDDTKIKKDNWVEKNYFRKKTANDSKETLFTLFDIYKKAHGMPSYT